MAFKRFQVPVPVVWRTLIFPCWGLVQGCTARAHERSYIIYTIYYILYTISYILYTIYFSLKAAMPRRMPYVYRCCCSCRLLFLLSSHILKIPQAPDAEIIIVVHMSSLFCIHMHPEQYIYIYIYTMRDNNSSSRHLFENNAATLRIGPHRQSHGRHQSSFSRLHWPR